MPIVIAVVGRPGLIRPDLGKQKVTSG